MLKKFFIVSLLLLVSSLKPGDYATGFKNNLSTPGNSLKSVVKESLSGLQWAFFTVDNVPFGKHIVSTSAQAKGRTKLEIDSISKFKPALSNIPTNIVDTFFETLSEQDINDILTNTCSFKSIDDLINWQDTKYSSPLSQHDALMRLLQSAAFEENQKKKKYTL